jgi:hypothetical protein
MTPESGWETRTTAASQNLATNHQFDMATSLKFSLSDASDFLNSDEEPEGSNVGRKSRTGDQVPKNFVQLSGQISSSDADDFDMDEEIEASESKGRSVSCKKKSPVTHSSTRNVLDDLMDESFNPQSTNKSQIKKRAGDGKMNMLSI